MNYNLVDEDDNKFVVGNGDSSFSIAKYGLDDGFMEKLRMLPRVGYAEGGIVEEPAPSALESGLKAQSGIGDIFGAIASPIGEAMQAGLEAPTPRGLQFAPYGEFGGAAEATSMPTGPVSEPIPGRTGATGTWSPEAGAPAAAPEATADTTPPYLKMMQEMAASGQPPSFAMPPEIMSGYQKMQQGTMAQAQAHADAAMEQARLYDEQAKDLELQQIAYRKQTEKLDSEIADLQKGIATQKIDPNRIWTNTNTGNRVLANISLLLGGLSQGLTGGKSNPAMDVINNAIDRDIDAQKAELGKKQNLLSLNLAKYGRLDQAFQATKMQIMAVTQAQINQQAAKMGSKQALAAAQVASGQMDVQIAMLKNKLASDFAASQKLQDPKGLSFDDIMKLDEKMREVMVPIPPTAGNQFKNRFIPAVSKEDATKIKTAYTLYQQTAPLLQRVRVAMDKGMTLPKTAQNDIANALKSEIILLQKNLQQLGQITEADMDLVNPLIPQVGKLFDAGERAKLDLLMKRNDELIDAAYMGKTGYNRAAYKGAEKPVFGGR